MGGLRRSCSRCSARWTVTPLLVYPLLLAYTRIANSQENKYRPHLRRPVHLVVLVGGGHRAGPHRMCNWVGLLVNFRGNIGAADTGFVCELRWRRQEKY